MQLRDTAETDGDACDRSYVSPAEEFGQRPKPNFIVEELEAGQRRQPAERAAIKERKKEK